MKACELLRDIYTSPVCSIVLDFDRLCPSDSSMLEHAKTTRARQDRPSTRARAAWPRACSCTALTECQESQRAGSGTDRGLEGDHEHAQKERQEFKLLKTRIEEISRDQSRVGMRWDWAAGPLHDVAVAIR